MSKLGEHLEVTPESPSETRVFFHEWISYNPQKNKVSFSDGAIQELQALVNTIQEHFSTEKESLKMPEEDYANIKVTRQTADAVTDAMIIAGKNDKTIVKFLNRFRMILKWTKRWWDLKEVTKQVEKKVEKYGHTHFAHILIQYNEWREGRSLPNVPLIVRPEENLKTMIHSLQARLGYAKIIG